MRFGRFIKNRTSIFVENRSEAATSIINQKYKCVLKVMVTCKIIRSFCIIAIIRYFGNCFEMVETYHISDSNRQIEWIFDPFMRLSMFSDFAGN